MPDVIFVNAHLPHGAGATLVGTLRTLRERVPHAAIVLLCLYPIQIREPLRSLADRCIPMDTSVRDLRALLDELRSPRSALRFASQS